MSDQIPEKIRVKGARVHNLKNVSVDIPLNRIVGIAGVSGFLFRAVLQEGTSRELFE